MSADIPSNHFESMTSGSADHCKFRKSFGEHSTRKCCPSTIHQIILKVWNPKVLSAGGFGNHFDTPALEGFPEKAALKCKMTI